MSKNSRKYITQINYYFFKKKIISLKILNLKLNHINMENSKTKELLCVQHSKNIKFACINDNCINRNLCEICVDKHPVEHNWYLVSVLKLFKAKDSDRSKIKSEIYFKNKKDEFLENNLQPEKRKIVRYVEGVYKNLKQKLLTELNKNMNMTLSKVNKYILDEETKTNNTLEEILKTQYDSAESVDEGVLFSNMRIIKKYFEEWDEGYKSSDLHFIMTNSINNFKIEIDSKLKEVEENCANEINKIGNIALGISGEKPAIFRRKSYAQIIDELPEPEYKDVEKIITLKSGLQITVETETLCNIVLLQLKDPFKHFFYKWLKQARKLKEIEAIEELEKKDTDKKIIAMDKRIHLRKPKVKITRVTVKREKEEHINNINTSEAVAVNKLIKFKKPKLFFFMKWKSVKN